jgi:hypothetical protein
VRTQHVRRENQKDKLDSNKMMSMEASIELEVRKEQREPPQQHKQFQSEVQPSSVLTKRIRRPPPSNRSEDFLW